MLTLKFNTKCCALVVLILCLIPILLAAPASVKKNSTTVRIRDAATGLRYNVYYYEDMSGYAIRLLIPKLKNVQNRIKNKNVGYSKGYASGPSVNLIESPDKADVLITTTTAPLLPPPPSPNKNCTQQEPDKQTASGIASKAPCLDEDYYDEDEDDLGDRLGQNAVLSLIG